MDIQRHILFEDSYFIALNKPALIPTQPDVTGNYSLQNIVEQYLNQPVYVVHRLDRVASGILVFAKNEEAAKRLSKLFQLRGVVKKYLTIVENKPPHDAGTLIHFLSKNPKTNTSKAYVHETKNAKLAELLYQLRGVSDRYYLLEIDLKTGRHHQIRAQLSAIGCPIKGDVKYGARRSNDNRAIHLHAWQLLFKHPFNQKDINIIATPPTDVLWDYFHQNH
jgi:23S rRNA pseudouridine1911/1915/1917 synthase